MNLHGSIPTDSRSNPAIALQSVSPRFENTYSKLPESFYQRIDPTPVAAPRLIKINQDLAFRLGLDPEALASAQGVDIFAGNRVAAGSEPLAIAYAGHQFGHFVPQLGDGRANLLGEIVGQDGVRYDIQLKGSGPTAFSRRGDGRAALGPVLREYIVSEAMAALGVPTTRALAAVTTGERVLRETVVPGAIFTRVAKSHIRVGTFQYFAARGDAESVRVLADYAIARHYPHAAHAGKPYRALLDGIIAGQANLIAQWMLLGFVHGVMNTDNMAISGETIDYGPCAFLEAYDADMVFSSIDRNGRYAYSNQPRAALWNLARLAEAMLSLLAEEEGSSDLAVSSATEALSAFEPQYEFARLDGMRRKIGLTTEQEGDAALVDSLLDCMATNRADFTLTFHGLYRIAAKLADDREVGDLFVMPSAFDAWAARWRDRFALETIDEASRIERMRKANPVFIPRNHLVEEVIVAAVEQQQFGPFEELVAVVCNPYDDSPGKERYASPARPEQVVTQTFCGT